MASSPIKLVSMMAKQIEGTSMSSDTTAHLDANGKTTANGANYDLDKYIQSAMFKNYTDQKGASLVFDKDSNKYLAQAAKDAGININIDTKHIIEQMSASNQPESSINSLKTVLEEKINAAKTAAPAGSTPAPVFSENLSSDVLTKLNAATIEVMTTSAGDLDNMKRMLGSMTPEQRGKLTDAQISAYQKIDSTFMAGSNNN
jgi:hydroxylamine reductase (hybrid-cluster protein)